MQKRDCMWVDVDSDTDDEEPILSIIYDNKCNRKYSRKGFNKICSDGLTSTSLHKHGWRYTETPGRNSFIYMKRHRVLKISKHFEVRDSYCPHVSRRIREIRILLYALRPMVPHVHHVKICNFNDDPALAIVMDRVGEDVRGRVTTSAIQSAAHRMTRHGVFSTDIVTDSVRVNRGNLAFSLTPKRMRLNVFFLDFDATENFVDTRNVPFASMFRIWYKVLCVCLDVPVDPISYDEYEQAQSRWRYHFT